MKVKEIMSSIIRASADSTVAQAAKIMDAKNIGSLLIEEHGKIIGIITERDILKKIVAKEKDYKNINVREIMTSPLITIGSEKSIDEANEIMSQKKIRRLPVESNGDIIGIVTIRDVSNALRYSLGRRIVENSETNYYKPSYERPI